MRQIPNETSHTLSWVRPPREQVYRVEPLFNHQALTLPGTDRIISPEFMRARSTQLSFPTRGGRRDGAGRPRGNRVSHATRPRFMRATPVHVTLRMRDHVWNLRSRRSFRRVRSCFEKARGRFGVRLVEFSVQGNHLHLILEADDHASLSRALQGLCIRIAKALNKMMGRAGKVFGDHYHAHLLTSPTALANAIAYVLGNAAHHFAAARRDPFSSAEPAAREVLSEPRTWLLRVGWRRARPRRPAHHRSPWSRNE